MVYRLWPNVSIYIYLPLKMYNNSLYTFFRDLHYKDYHNDHLLQWNEGADIYESYEMLIRPTEI